jgi:hypothetical protein
MSNQPTDAEIEGARRLLVKEMAEKMIAEGAVLAHHTIGLRLEAAMPGFLYIAKLDDFRAVIDQTIPPMVADLVEAAVVAGADAGQLLSGADAGQLPAPDTVDPEQLRAELHSKEMDRAETRQQLYAAEAARGIARTILAQCISTFVSGRPPVTQQQLATDFCAASILERQRAKDRGRGDIPPAAVNARSAIDREAAFANYSGNNADAFLKKRMVTGHRRGAYPQSQKGRFVGTPKLPSER